MHFYSEIQEPHRLLLYLTLAVAGTFQSLVLRRKSHEIIEAPGISQQNPGASSFLSAARTEYYRGPCLGLHDSLYLKWQQSLKIHKGRGTLGYYSEVKMIQVKKYSEINVLDTGKITVLPDQIRN